LVSVFLAGELDFESDALEEPDDFVSEDLESDDVFSDDELDDPESERSALRRDEEALSVR
jgi:hypothetical protein